MGRRRGRSPKTFRVGGGIGHSVVGRKPKLTMKETTTKSVFGHEFSETTKKQEVSPPPEKHTAEESTEAEVQVNPIAPSAGVAGKKTTKKTLEFKQSDSKATPPPSTNTGNTAQSQTPSSTQ